MRINLQINPYWLRHADTNAIIPKSLSSALDDFEQKADGVIRQCVAELDAEPKPDVVFHYTNEAGLKGILETGKLWLTDVLQLNDPSEIKHGLSSAAGQLRIRTIGARGATKFFVDTFGGFRHEGLAEAAHFFCCCLSGDGDLLDQWRSYADNGRGFAIGFNTDQLRTAFHQDTSFACLSCSLTYDDQRLLARQSALVEAVLPSVGLPSIVFYPPQVQRAYFVDLGTALSINALTVALLHKHPAYQHEAEYRLLVMRRADEPPPGLRFRTRDHSQVRYVEFDWRNLAPTALREIVVGPSADFDQASQFVRGRLGAYSPEVKVAITRSKIPYRAA